MRALHFLKETGRTSRGLQAQDEMKVNGFQLWKLLVPVPTEGEGDRGTSPSYMEIVFLLLPSVHLLQVVVLNSSLSVFLTLTMVLCDPGGKLMGSAFPQGNSSAQALGLR